MSSAARNPSLVCNLSRSGALRLPLGLCVPAHLAAAVQVHCLFLRILQENGDSGFTTLVFLGQACLLFKDIRAMCECTSQSLQKQKMGLRDCRTLLSNLCSQGVFRNSQKTHTVMTQIHVDFKIFWQNKLLFFNLEDRITER